MRTALQSRANDLSNDGGTGCHTQLHHDEPQERTDGVGADIHSMSDLLVRKSLDETLQGFLLPWGQMKLSGDL